MAKNMGNIIRDIYTKEYYRFNNYTEQQKQGEYDDRAGRHLAALIMSSVTHQYCNYDVDLWSVPDDQIHTGYGRPDFIAYTGFSNQEYVLLEVKLRDEKYVKYYDRLNIKRSKVELLCKYRDEYHAGIPIYCLYIYCNNPSNADISNVKWQYFDLKPEQYIREDNKQVHNESYGQDQYVITNATSGIISPSLQKYIANKK